MFVSLLERYNYSTIGLVRTDYYHSGTGFQQERHILSLNISGATDNFGQFSVVDLAGEW